MDAISFQSELLQFGLTTILLSVSPCAKTCTPYLIGNKPKFGEHIAWSESSAVIYANSILGARSNRESGISALASALIGKTPKYGMHIKSEREPKVRIKVKTEILNSSDYGALAYAISQKIKSEIPWIEGLKKISERDLKIFSASLATFTDLPIYHIPNVTAEYKDFKPPSEVVEIDKKDIEEAYEYLRDPFEDVDLIWIGCPHLDLGEIGVIASLLRGNKVKVELWITVSREIWNKANRLGYIKDIESSGAKVFCDTCIAVAPLKNKFRNLITNSAKACYYCRGLNRFSVKVYSLKECIKLALK